MTDLGNNQTLNRLPSSTVKLISSAQVITSVSSVVKELMENSLDAGASSIEIYLESHGLDRIEVKDNGIGIKEEDVQYMCQRSYTSKITDFSDLEKLNSYGFRGEALYSICAVADVSVKTIPSGASFGQIYKMNHNGDVIESKPTNLDRGTSICVTNLFKNLPVRKQFLTSGKRKAEEMKKVEAVVKMLALINCEVKIRLTHNKFTIFQKASVCSIARSLIQVLPPSIVKQLQELTFQDKETKIKFTLLVPKQDCNIVTTCLGHSSDAVYLFVNSRPVREKQIEKVIHEKVFEFFGSKIPVRKYPAMVASVILPPDMIDVNLEPNKTRVLIKDVDVLCQLLRDQLSIYYYGMDEDTIMKEAIAMGPPKRKISPTTVSCPSKKKPKNDLQNDSNLSDGDSDSIKSTNDVSIANGNVNGKSDEQISNRLPELAKPADNEEISSASSIFDPIDVSTPSTEEVMPLFTSDKEATISAFLEGIDARTLNSPKSPEVDLNETDETSCKPIMPDDPFDLLRKNKYQEEMESIPVFESQFFSQPKNESPLKPESDLDDRPMKEEKRCEGSTLIKSINDNSAKQNSDLEEFNLSSWSRGDVRVDGKQLEGTTAIAGPQMDVEPPALSSESLSASSSAERSVSSQMGQKDMSAFTKFARQTRIEIVKAEPGISFAKIAKELSRRWQELQDEDKQVYKEMAVADKQGNAHKNVPSKNTVTPPRRKRSTESVRPVISKYVKTYHAVENVDVKLDDVREYIKNRNVADFDEDTPEIVADINDDLSLIKERSGVTVFSCFRLNEAIKFYNNLNNMILDLKVLDEKIVISKKDLGPLWDTLESLDSNVDVHLQANQLLNAHVISDERITKNGFRIEKLGSPPSSKYTITHTAQNITGYGLDDLKEVLEKIAANEMCHLRSCRPCTVVNLIRDETVRLLAAEQQFTRTSYTIDLYKHWSKKIRQCQMLCPHFQPVEKRVFPPNE